MTKAEELATRLYPIEIDTRWGPLPGGGISEVDVNKVERLACIKGYEAAQKDLGWISVKERLPKEVFDDGYQFVYVAIKVDEDTWQFCTDYIRNGKWELHPDANIVYWMPIPELPKKK